MTVIYKSSFGAFLDHYTATEQITIPGKDKHPSLKETPKKDIHYRWKRDLFQVSSPFMMDSQVERLQREEKEKPADATQETSAQRKKRRGKKKARARRQRELEELEGSLRKKKERMKSPLSDQEVKIAEDISAALPNLISEARRAGCLHEMENAVGLTSSNNQEYRHSAQIVGCEDLFRNLCSEQNTDSYEQPLDGGVHHFLGDSTKSLSATSIIGTVLYNQEVQHKTVIVDSHKFLIPGKVTFLTSDFHHFVTQGFQDIKVQNGYSLIVIDPPWQNKSVKRKKSYHMFEEADLKQIPISQLAGNDCFVCVWITNNEKIMHFVKDELFPHWSVKWVADWIWMKVTVFGQPVCDVLSSHKKSYEQLVIGRYKCPERKKCDTADGSVQPSNTEEAAPQSAKLRDNIADIPSKYIIVSIPCALHSKKPPLQDLFSAYVPSNPNCLELFARNLLAGWTSWGNEPLKHQHIDYFEQSHLPKDEMTNHKTE